MSVKNNVLAVPLSSFNTTGLTTAYQAINTSGFAHPCFYIKIVNNSGTDITLSYDGVNDHEFVRTKTDLPLNFQTNSQPQAQSALLRKGTVVYVKGAGASTGLVYLSGYYTPQN